MINSPGGENLKGDSLYHYCLSDLVMTQSTRKGSRLSELELIFSKRWGGAQKMKESYSQFLVHR